MKDYTKYTFEGGRYGKSGLVLAVVKKYLSDHPNTTAAKLSSTFPKKETGCPLNVVSTVKEAAPGRFFFNDVIKTKDAKVVVTTQWTKDSIDKFIRFVRKNLHVKIQQHKVAPWMMKAA